MADLLDMMGMNELTIEATAIDIEIPPLVDENWVRSAIRNKSALPAEGFARDEVLKERTDDLEQQIEDAPEKMAIDPKAFEPDNEIRGKIDELDVTGKLPNFIYKWEYYGGNGFTVERSKIEGWEVIAGDMPECSELKGNDTTRKLGDTLLMRTTLENYEKIEARRLKKVMQREQSVLGDMRELAKKYGVTVHEDISNVTSPNKREMLIDTIARSAARRTASQMIDKRLRTGTMPGLRTPGGDN